MLPVEIVVVVATMSFQLYLLCLIICDMLKTGCNADSLCFKHFVFIRIVLRHLNETNDFP